MSSQGKSGRPASGHTMRVLLDRGAVLLVPVCHELDGSPCRVMCVLPDCEPDGPEHEHELKPVNFCTLVQYMMEESYSIEEDFLSDSLTDCRGRAREVPLYDGMPITISWDSFTESYRWDVVSNAHSPYCSDCDHDTHSCKGCGCPVMHGRTMCSVCLDNRIDRYLS